MAKRIKHDGPTRAVIYTRVSTDEQADSGLGLAAQEEACVMACKLRGWVVVKVLTDAGVSGSLAPANRPAMRSALDLLCAGEADVLVGAKLDRFSRSARDMLNLIGHADDCKFLVSCADGSVDMSTDTGRLFIGMLASIAEFERRQIGSRTKSALAIRKAEGVRLGRPVTTSALIRMRVKGLSTQDLSLASIADRLNAEGYRNGAGNEWTRSGVQKVLKSLALDAEAEALTGLVSHGR